MTDLKFSGVLVPDTDNQAAPETRGGMRPTRGDRPNSGKPRRTHAEAEFQALLATYPARAVARVTLHPGARQNTRELDVQGREAAPPPN